MATLPRVHAYIISTLLVCVANQSSKHVWHWKCIHGQCMKTPIKESYKGPLYNLETCRMFCHQYGILWPRPTGAYHIGRKITTVNINDIRTKVAKTGKADDLVNAAIKRFKKNIGAVLPKGVTPINKGKSLHIHLNIEDADFKKISLAMNESYHLVVLPASGTEIIVTITSKTFFGMRHGLETLSQLIIYDELKNYVTIVTNASIHDGPVYPYRGILLDTSRNYHSVQSIKKTIDAMAVVKLNTFHWHITDMQSFPFASERRPELTKYGAFSPEKIYTKEAIKEIVKFATERGIRVLPEFDTPAHVGEGWQFTNLTLCFKTKLWGSVSKSPPGGLLDPSKDEVYNVIKDIYTEFAEAFSPDLFHMGSDEVMQLCWTSTKSVQNFIKAKGWSKEEVPFNKVLDYYQKNAQVKAYEAFGRIPLIVWSSKLTESDDISSYFSKRDYIIQTYSEPPKGYKLLLKAGYKIIMSDYLSLFLDCGYGSWTGPGMNWCKYTEWQKVYSYNLTNLHKAFPGQILGGEASLWSETSDELSLENKLWPRAAALAERVWSDPNTKWTKAQYRFYHIRNHLTRLGVNADSVQNEWCYQNEGFCPNQNPINME